MFRSDMTGSGMKALLWGGGVIGLGGAAIAVGALRSGGGGSEGPERPPDSTATAPAPAPAPRRDAASVVTATGVIEPRVGAEVRVGSRISGVVKRLHVHIGDPVRRGQLLAELDDRDLAARHAEATATLQRLAVELRYQAIELERKRTLRAANSVTPAELDAAERAYGVAEQQALGARAALAYAAAQLEYARITAPIAGVVASVSTQEGETVAASFAAPTFLTLIDLTRLEVRAYVDETDIGRIRTGQAARFTVDTYGDQEFAGRVTAVYPKAEIRDNVVNYITVVSFRAPRNHVLRPSMTTTVRITVGNPAEDQ
jgi:RND family efflux transporter MFP subunit